MRDLCHMGAYQEFVYHISTGARIILESALLEPKCMKRGAVFKEYKEGAIGVHPHDGVIWHRVANMLPIAITAKPPRNDSRPTHESINDSATKHVSTTRSLPTSISRMPSTILLFRSATPRRAYMTQQRAVPAKGTPVTRHLPHES